MMMFNLYVQQNQWLVVAVLTGTILAILVTLTYQALWRPRKLESEEEKQVAITGPASFFHWLFTFMPWVLVLIIIGTTLYTITHLHLAATTLPNW